MSSDGFLTHYSRECFGGRFAIDRDIAAVSWVKRKLKRNRDGSNRGSV